MNRKYGKKLNISKINRNLQYISEAMSENSIRCNDLKLDSNTKRESCICCDSIDWSPFLTLHDKYHYYECKNCGAILLEMFPSVKEMYTSEMSQNGRFYCDPDTYYNRVRMIAAPKARFILKEIGSGQVNKWLDIGCGGGELLYYLTQSTKINAIGLESDPYFVSYTRDLGLNVQSGFVDSEKEDIGITSLLKDKDVVSLFNVLEHVEYPNKYLNYLYESMKRDSYLVIEVPKHPSLASFANITSHNHVYRHIDPPIHLQIYSIKSLEIMLKGKFDILSFWEFGQGFMDVINNAMLLSDLRENELYNQIIKASNSIQKAVDREGLGDQVLLLAKRL